MSKTRPTNAHMWCIEETHLLAAHAVPRLRQERDETNLLDLEGQPQKFTSYSSSKVLTSSVKPTSKSQWLTKANIDFHAYRATGRLYFPWPWGVDWSRLDSRFPAQVQVCSTCHHSGAQPGGALVTKDMLFSWRITGAQNLKERLVMPLRLWRELAGTLSLLPYSIAKASHSANPIMGGTTEFQGKQGRSDE